MTTVRPNQIWREDDPRMERYVRVLRVNAERAEIQGCTLAGLFTLRSRPAWAKLARFGKARGYRLISDAGDPA